MPRISEFYGIVIAMFWTDHPPPHFHALYAGLNVQISIETGRPLTGRLPRRQARMVRDWTVLHRDDLMEAWDKAQQGVTPDRIEPLP